MGDDVNARTEPEQLPYGPYGSGGAGDPATPGSEEPRRPNPRLEAFVTGAAYGALALAGLMLGVIESFSFSWSLGVVPLAAVGWCLVNLAVFYAAGRGMGGKLGATVPTLTWLAVVVVLSLPRPEGDLVITGTLAGNLFVYGGALAAGLAVLLAPSSHEWLLGAAGKRDG